MDKNMKYKNIAITAPAQFFYKVHLKTLVDVNNFCFAMASIGKFVADVKVKSGGYIVDGKSIMGLFSLELTTPVEVWFTVNKECELSDSELEEYFSDKVRDWIVE